jgi:hypothetical protein
MLIQTDRSIARRQRRPHVAAVPLLPISPSCRHPRRAAVRRPLPAAIRVAPSWRIAAVRRPLSAAIRSRLTAIIVQDHCLASRGDMTDDDDDDDDKVAQCFRKLDEIDDAMESEGSDEDIDHEQGGGVPAATGASSGISSKKNTRFKWHYTVQAGGAQRVTHPFLNDNNTADLLL